MTETRAGEHHGARTAGAEEGPTMQRNTLIIAGAAVVVAAGGAFYAFRPDRAFVDETVNETLPDAEGSSILASGRFRGIAHETEGIAEIRALGNGKRILRLRDFKTSNGPDVRVYLVAAADAADNEAVKKAGFVELGPMKGNQGDQNYDVPADLDLEKYQAATIWCARFGVNFGTAPLKKPEG